ncbi:MAG: flippase-like domain-containing protein, partial [Candidatus Aenigmarchaeota archaeon]|nr:flippase-like domain-containing protein [Candidatus Aenigmarchaeota archaeon]
MKYVGILGIFLSLGILMGLVSYGGGFYSIINTFSGADVVYLSFSVFFYILMLAGFAFRWMRFSIASNIFKKFTLFFKLQFIGHWISTITPFFMSGGEPAKAYLLSKYTKIKKSKTLATLVHPWFFDLASFLIMDAFVFVFIVFFIK